MGNNLHYLKPTARMERQARFRVEDCALAAESTGKRAHSLQHLRDTLLDVSLDSIYYHFWGGLLRPGDETPRFPNDFARWALTVLKDNRLANRLAVVDPVDYVDLEGLRRDLIGILDRRLDETGTAAWTRREDRFHFIRSQIVVFDTRLSISKPAELPEIVPRMSSGSIFYHFIDARRRTHERVDDFRAWLSGTFDGYEPLCEKLARLNTFCQSPAQLRRRLADLFGAYFRG